MQFTNKADLPEAICKAIANDEYDKGDAKYSVSNLIQPIQAYHLIHRNAKLISIDYADEIWKLFGSAVHYILEKGIDPAQSYISAEDRMYIRIGGINVSGKPDLRDTLAGIIDDYKVTSVWKVLKHDYEDWEAQLNCYRLMADSKGEQFDKLRIVAILKDWKKFEIQRDENYPKIPVAKIDINVWDKLKTHRFILDRVALLEEAESLTDEQLATMFPCSPKERWHKPDSFVCVKPGNKKASAVFDNHDEAFAYIETHPECVMEIRPGEDTRCLEFCLAKPFCKQFNKQQVLIPGDKEIEQSINNLLNSQSFDKQTQELTLEDFKKDVASGFIPADTLPKPKETIEMHLPEMAVVPKEELSDYEKSILQHRERAFAHIDAQKEKDSVEDANIVSETPSPTIENILGSEKPSIEKAVDDDIENLFKDLGL